MLKIAWSPRYAHSLPEGHRFPMAKYDLIPEQLLYEGTISSQNLFEPKFCEESVILQTHSLEYWEKLKCQTLSAKEIRKIGFPLSPELVQREIQIAQGAIDSALFALQYGVGMNVAGGTHHAFGDSGEGFCLLNDLAITCNYLLEKQLVTKILIIDLDVHQGNGTARLFQKNPAVFTFSMHCGANYPLQKEISDLDIELPINTPDSDYLALLYHHLPRLLDQVKPDFVCYLAGVDILHTDKLGRLACTQAGCKKRDEYVLKLCKQHHLPVAIAMGGGYSVHIRDIVEAHCNTYRLAQEIWF